MPSQNPEENLNACKNDSAELYYAMTYKGSADQAHGAFDKHTDSAMEAKFYAEHNGEDNVLIYALGKFNDRLDKILGSEGDSSKSLSAFEIAFNQYKIFGIGEVASDSIDEKLQSNNDKVEINRFPELQNVLAKTQEKFDDCVSHLTELSQTNLSKEDEQKAYEMLIESQIVSIENKIAQGIGIGLQDEEGQIMIVGIEQLIDDVETFNDFDLTEKTVLRVIQALLDMRRYDYANQLNDSLIQKRLELEDFGAEDPNRIERIPELMFNRVKIDLLGDLNYVSVAELMNDLSYIVDKNSCDWQFARETSDMVDCLSQGNLPYLQGIPAGSAEPGTIMEAHYLYRLLEIRKMNFFGDQVDKKQIKSFGNEMKEIYKYYSTKVTPEIEEKIKRYQDGLNQFDDCLENDKSFTGLDFSRADNKVVKRTFPKPFPKAENDDDSAWLNEL